MQTVTINGCNYGALTSIMVLVSIGVVTAVDMALDGAVFTSTGLLGGQYLLNPGHSLKITYAVAPTMKYYPV